MIEFYAQIKWVHVASIIASGMLFLLRGSLVVACVKRDADGRMKGVPIPPWIADKIQAAPPELLAS